MASRNTPSTTIGLELFLNELTPREQELSDRPLRETSDYLHANGSQRRGRLDSTALGALRRDGRPIPSWDIHDLAATSWPRWPASHLPTMTKPRRICQKKSWPIGLPRHRHQSRGVEPLVEMRGDELPHRRQRRQLRDGLHHLHATHVAAQLSAAARSVPLHHAPTCPPHRDQAPTNSRATQHAPDPETLNGEFPPLSRLRP